MFGTTCSGLGLITLLVAGLLSRVQGLIVQDDWVAPSGPDNQTTLIIGAQYTIQWTNHLWAWFKPFAPSADVSNVDLWITGFYQHQYGHLVSQRVNVNTTTNLVWRVQVPADELYASPYWVFRFLPSGLTFADTSDSISSPGFIIVNLTTTSSTSTSGTSSTTSSSSATNSATIASSVSPTGLIQTSTDTVTSSPSLASVVPSPTSTSTSSQNAPSGLSTGAKIGIIVAAVLLVICIAAVTWFLVRRRRSRSRSNTQAVPQPTTNAKDAYRYQGPGELAGSTKFNAKHEVYSVNRSELGHAGNVRYGSTQPYELPS